jgi:SAM-dependent methyltransferase
MALVHGDPSSSMPEAERQRLESLIAASCARDGVDIHHGNPEYWRARYAASAECGGGAGSGDWVCSFGAVGEAFAEEVDRGARILHIGCGDSVFAAEMHSAGFTDSLHTDFDAGVIEQQRKRSASLKWAALDACDMAACDAASYDAVVDKGCLDIFLPILMGAVTSEAEEEQMLANAGRMLREVWRVLRPGGKYICISLHVHSALVLRACSGMRHNVRFGGDGFAQVHSGSEEAGLLAELRSALHADTDGSGGKRAPALLHTCTKPAPAAAALPPPMWDLAEYRAACNDLDRSMLAQQRPEALLVLLGLLGWCGLRYAGHDAEAAALISVLAVVYGIRVYLRTAFRADAARAGSKAWLFS